MLLLPGDVLPAKGALTKLGPGTLQTSARSAPAAAAAGSSSSSASPLLVATRAGLVGSDSKGKRMWVEGRGKRVRIPCCCSFAAHETGGLVEPTTGLADDTSSSTDGSPLHPLPATPRQYIPAAQESVVGTIVARHGEGYRVDIGGAHMASLDALAFENATKRNRPNLKVRLRLRSVAWSLAPARSCCTLAGPHTLRTTADSRALPRSAPSSTPACRSPTATWSPSSSALRPRATRPTALASSRTAACSSRARST